MKVAVQFYAQTSTVCCQSLSDKILIPHCHTVKCLASVHTVPVVMFVGTIKVKELAVSVAGGALLE